MPESILGRDANPGLLLHEWTKNFRGGMVYPHDSRTDGATNAAHATGATDAAGAWVERLFRAPAAREDFAPPETSGDAADGAGGGRSCLQTFARRLSVRQYAATPLKRDQLARVLALCYPRTSPDEAATDAPVGGLRRGLAPVTSCRLFPLAVNVEGLTSGAYLYDAAPPSLRRVRDEDPRALIEENCFQAEFTHAPALILMVGSLAESLAREGDRGYRSLLMESGLMIQRLYLAAGSLGLVGCVTGSLIQPRFNEWLGMDGFNATTLMAFAVGHAVAAESAAAKPEDV